MGDEVRNRVVALDLDPGALYEKELIYDVIMDLVPFALCPNVHNNVMNPVPTISGTNANLVHIGSCSKGRYKDKRAKYDVLMATGEKYRPEQV